nr:MAG TPA: hypothetical protein [Caudoviricetes sp.]
MIYSFLNYRLAYIGKYVEHGTNVGTLWAKPLCLRWLAVPTPVPAPFILK